MNTRLWGVLCILLLLVWHTPAQATGTWPQKSIQVIVPWGPGGGSDVSARIVMNKVATILGQSIVVTNITGASGLNGSLRAYEARPDGYTILWEHPASLTFTPVFSKAAYGWKDFSPACSIGGSEVAVIVKGDAKWHSMQELIADIKAHPGTIKWGMILNLAASHFTYLAISESAGGLNVMQVPGPGDKARVLDIMSGVCDVTTVAYASAAPYVRSGDIRILAMASPERSQLAPEYPTLNEQGLTAESVFLYSALFPKGTPQHIIDTLAAAVQKALQDPEVIEQLRKQGIVAHYRDAAQTEAIWAKEAALNIRLAKENAIIP